MADWIAVHDAKSINRKRPEGKPILVRASSIIYIRPYATGKVRAVLATTHGAYLHVTEDADTVIRLIADSEVLT